MNSDAESVSGMESVPRGLCTLIKYHAAKVARDDGEWSCWGAPYVRMCATILYVYDFTVPNTRQEVLMDPIVLSDVSEAESPGDISHVDPSWNLVRHNKEYFEEIVRNLRNYEHKETLKIVLGLIMSKNFEMGNYDSRVRSIMRNIFGIVKLPLEYLFSLESQYVQCTGPYFNPADISTVGSAVTPFRSLQVCAVALSTGVVMYGVGKLTVMMLTIHIIVTIMIIAIHRCIHRACYYYGHASADQHRSAQHVCRTALDRLGGGVRVRRGPGPAAGGYAGVVFLGRRWRVSYGRSAQCEHEDDPPHLASERVRADASVSATH